MEKSRIDLPVALIFFNRPEQFSRVFESVKQARPSKLFLIQDGPRPGHPKDAENIQKCREIIKVDWDCEIETDFSEVNLGCGKRIFSGLSRCFEKTDRLVIIEDDCVPAQSFFPYCQELLEKYQEDDRVGLITGMNHLGRFDAADSDYFFANVGAIWGWATWKRCWEGVVFDLCETEQDSAAMRLLRNYEKYAPHRSSVYASVRKKARQLRHGEQLSSWSTQFGVNQILHSQLVIVPRLNLIRNIGLTSESANSPGGLQFVPRALRPLYQLDLFELQFPLKHPRYIISDYEFNQKVDSILNPNKVVGMTRKLESVILRLLGGDFAGIGRGIWRRLNRIFR